MATAPEEEMAAPDIFRSVLISLAALLIGTVTVGAYTAWRDRLVPVPRRAPFSVVLLFVTGYVLLLVQLVVDRWLNLGDSVGPGAILAMLALALNAVAMILLVRSSQPDPPPHVKGRRDMPTPTPYAFGMQNVGKYPPPASESEPLRLVEREPALLAGGAASGTVGVLIAAFVGVLSSFGVIDVGQASALELFLTALVSAAMIAAPWAAARFTRKRVMPVATLERANLQPEHVNAVASNPRRSFTEAPFDRDAGQHDPRRVD
jgi:hypothetical protein